jgi:hypothetical protein
MARDPEWVERFAVRCGEPGLPDTWQEACALPEGPERTSALVSFAHIAFAIGEYERS